MMPAGYMCGPLVPLIAYNGIVSLEGSLVTLHDWAKAKSEPYILASMTAWVVLEGQKGQSPGSNPLFLAQICN